MSPWVQAMTTTDSQLEMLWMTTTHSCTLTRVLDNSGKVFLTVELTPSLKLESRIEVTAALKDWVVFKSKLEAKSVEEFQTFQQEEVENGTLLNAKTQLLVVALRLSQPEMTTFTSHKSRSMVWRNRNFQSQKVPPSLSLNQLVKNTETLLPFLSMMNKFTPPLNKPELVQEDSTLLQLNQELITFSSRELMTLQLARENQEDLDVTSTA